MLCDKLRLASVDNLVVVDVVVCFVVEKGQPSTEGAINDYTERHDEIAGWLRWMDVRCVFCVLLVFA